mgnify:CR=1 FL=1
MQVKASKKTMLAFTILAAAMAFVVLVHMGTTLWKTRGYERVQGQILGVDDSYIRRDSGDSTVVHKIYFSYRVGESEYSDFYEDLTRWGAKAGKKITVSNSKSLVKMKLDGKVVKKNTVVKKKGTHTLTIWSKNGKVQNVTFTIK